MTNLNSVTDDRLDAAVRRLDPAAAAGPGLSAAEQHRADDLRARILSTGPDENVLGRPPTTPTPSPRGRRRWVLAGAAVVAVSAGLLVAPLFGDEERRPTAWSATPTALSNDTARELGERCLESVDRFMERPNQPPPEGSFTAEQRGAMRVVVAERRGPYDVVVLGNAAGYDLECTYMVGEEDPTAAGGPFPLITPSPSSVSVTGSGASTHRLVDGRSITETVSALYGRVGSDVSGVTLSTSAGDVTATVTNGWFAAVWPGTDPLDGDPFGKVTVTLTLADGTQAGPTAYKDLPQRDLPPELQEPTD